ncbi:hypothetical protein EV363DRAFT_1262895 [Boletus edulis]|nr:hypothetical protein EV363DRAFT_1262895 [Boletus edulis]
MSSDVQPALQLQQLNDHTSVVTLTAVIYDYTLTFSGEVDYIWHKPWTCVSTMFVLVRYIGLCWAICAYSQGTITFLIQGWIAPFFFAASDLVMILWVYAMWNQSKRILYILLFIYVPVSLSFLVSTGIFINPNTNLTVTISQLINFSVCDGYFTNTVQVANELSAILQFALSGTILTLTIARTLKQSLELYKATKQWKPNKYIQQLLKDAVLYFLVYASSFTPIHYYSKLTIWILFFFMNL